MNAASPRPGSAVLAACTALNLFFLAAFSRAAASEAVAPTTPNPGLRYYYPVPAATAPQTLRVDICVYGGTPAGVGAAIQARRMGKTAALAVFRRHVGGLTSAGLTAVDLGKKESIGGMAEEFLNRMGKWSGFRSADAERTFRAMLAAVEVPVWFEHRLARAEKDGNRIRAIVFENGDRIEAAMFIDATYEGDLLAGAGVCYAVGREGNALYREKFNGSFLADKHQFRFPVDPYRTPGDSKSGLLPGISAAPLPPRGTADKRVQAYNFRMFLNRAAEGLPFPQPAGYNRDDYALFLRYLTSAPPGFVWDWTYVHGPIKLNLGDCNNAGPVSTDFIGGSDRWPEAGYAERERIFQAHVTYQQGMMWFLAHDPAVPENLRAHVTTFGLPRDQFEETGGWPHELYVREGRRMISDYVMTEHNCTGETVAEDSVGLASYTMDSHHTSRVVVDGIVRAEGNVEINIPRPYPVSYRAIVPHEKDCANLLVPVALSASHIAFGSIRMEPVFLLLGQSAATAAALAIDGKTSVQSVDYSALRDRLVADHQRLDWAPPSGDRTVVERTPGLVAFWTFGENAGSSRLSSGTKQKHSLVEIGGPIPRVRSGPFSGYAADLDGHHYFSIPYAETGDLNISGPAAQVSMFAVVRISNLKQSRTIAGMWSEGKGANDDTGTRQYALLMNMPTYGGPDKLVPHISSEGGVTRRADGSAFPWCADYAVSAQPVPAEEWCTLGFTYDGQFIRAYVNGVLSGLTLDPVVHKRTDQYFTKEGPNGGDRGMNPYFHGRGIFKFAGQPGKIAGSDFTVGARYAVGKMLAEATIGRFGALAVFNRALTPPELHALHAAANLPALH